MENFSIIIPTLNEAENIELLLTHISDVLQTMEATAEILIVDDGSTDNTLGEVIAEFGMVEFPEAYRRRIETMSSMSPKPSL